MNDTFEFSASFKFSGAVQIVASSFFHRYNLWLFILNSSIVLKKCSLYNLEKVKYEVTTQLL